MGEWVIVDATFLTGAQRQALATRAAASSIGCVTAYCDAPVAVLQDRISARLQDPQAVSEAGLEVLERQRQTFEAPQAEPKVVVDTTQQLDYSELARQLRRELR